MSGGQITCCSPGNKGTLPKPGCVAARTEVPPSLFPVTQQQPLADSHSAQQQVIWPPLTPDPVSFHGSTFYFFSAAATAQGGKDKTPSDTPASAQQGALRAEPLAASHFSHCKAVATPCSALGSRTITPAITPPDGRGHTRCAHQKHPGVTTRSWVLPQFLVERAGRSVFFGQALK